MSWTSSALGTVLAMVFFCSHTFGGKRVELQIHLGQPHFSHIHKHHPGLHNTPLPTLNPSNISPTVPYPRRAKVYLCILLCKSHMISRGRCHAFAKTPRVGDKGLHVWRGRAWDGTGFIRISKPSVPSTRECVYLIGGVVSFVIVSVY